MRGVGQLMSNWYSLLRTQHQPLFLTVHSLLNVILPLLVMAKLSLERTTAVWSEFIREGLRLCLCLVTTRSSFPTTRKVSYFLNPLILVRTCPQLRVETIIKEEFEPVISSDLLCLRVEWVFFFYVYSLSVPHLQQALGFNSEWRGGMVMNFRCRHALRKILPITEIFIA